MNEANGGQEIMSWSQNRIDEMRHLAHQILERDNELYVCTNCTSIRTAKEYEDAGSLDACSCGSVYHWVNTEKDFVELLELVNRKEEPVCQYDGDFVNDGSDIKCMECDGEETCDDCAEPTKFPCNDREFTVSEKMAVQNCDRNKFFTLKGREGRVFFKFSDDSTCNLPEEMETEILSVFKELYELRQQRTDISLKDLLRMGIEVSIKERK